MNEHILICDDEKDIVAFIKDALEDEKYKISVAYDGEEAIEKAKNNPDLILLDIMMPGKDGYEVCKLIRERICCPIIFLTAKQEETDKIKGLALGGDDYILKPFSIRELKARIAAHLRREKRSQGDNNKKSRVHFHEISIDILERRVYVKSEIINFTRREFDIIEFLALNAGHVFSREQIYEKIWGYDAEGDSASVAEHVKNIRSKMITHGVEKEYIGTVWGIGYRWDNL